MKNLFIILGCASLLLLISVGWWVTSKANLFMLKGMVMTELVGDVSAFYGDNKRLPLSWDEFVSWSEKANTGRHWRGDLPELDSRFALKWGAQVSSTNPEAQKLFFVLSPEFKDIERSANNKLYAGCIAHGSPNETTSAKQDANQEEK